jgi:hypothetical protein
MRPEPGHTIQWRRQNGQVVQMRVDVVHEIDGERWLFSVMSKGGGFIAVNQKFVLGVK